MNFWERQGADWLEVGINKFYIREFSRRIQGSMLRGLGRREFTNGEVGGKRNKGREDGSGR